MATNVVMPQMGESIAEGTIVRWIKKVGDSVDRDEPLFEISTDKVDAEIPSPSAGVLTEIKVKEGETVPVNSVVATIGAAGEAAAKPPASSDAGAQLPRKACPNPLSDSPKPVPRKRRRRPIGPRSVNPGRPPRRHRPARRGSRPGKNFVARSLRRWCGELPRNTTSTSSRSRAPASADESRKGTFSATSSPVHRNRRRRRTLPPAGPAFRPGENVQVVPMSVMRRKIAEHMVLSAHTSPHVYSVYEVNFGRVSAMRDKRKREYEAAGAKLTFTAFIAKVVVDALRQFPIVNASVDGDNIVYKKDINLGIAVALENGLIVPVIRNADEKNLLGLTRAINDLAVRARSKKLNPDEVQGGTFTITNPGIFGALYGLPLINQPQVAILGVGAIEKRAVVVDDAIGIRPMCHLSLGYDHRLVDGADAGRFLSFIKERLEGFDEAWC